MRTTNLLLAAAFLALGPGAAPAHACHDGSPLILDLNGDGVRTTSLVYPVDFDLDGDGERETIAWTFWESEEAILFLDLDGDGRARSGRELFGDATLLPTTGEPAQHGFEALAVYDLPEMGGDGNGIITPRDWVWSRLRLWIDRNHDGVSQREEIDRLGRHRVVALGLDYEESDAFDGAMNFHRYQGVYAQRAAGGWGSRVITRAMDDVFFRIAHDDHGDDQPDPVDGPTGPGD